MGGSLTGRTMMSRDSENVAEFVLHGAVDRNVT